MDGVRAIPTGIIPGYSITGLVCETRDFATYRAGLEDGETVLLKCPARADPSSALLRKLEHEYEVARVLDPAWVARPVKLEHAAVTTVLILENGDVESLASRPKNARPLGQLLDLSIGLARALTEVHRHGFVHKDLQPDHILISPEGRVRLTGFGIAQQVPRDRQALVPPEIIAGTLAYMAPEQTGRMNRSLDCRADLYSLGVILYELLTGELPFTANDPMGWVHCHIAGAPKPPSERVSGIPEPLSKIVLKLLSKAAEERYQTASGLVLDLQRCRDEWTADGRIDPFPLGSRDISERLLFPEKLYGREAEVGALLEAFRRVVAGGAPELVVVSGYSGIGKSSVVNELHRALVPLRGLFAAGKFDPFKRNIPHAALGTAFRMIVRRVLAKSDAELEQWRQALCAALNPNGQLLIHVVPELEFIIGKQPPVPELPPQEAQNRLNMSVRRFLGVFARPEHPLVLFLDDLQWLDAATLRLLEYLVAAPELRPFLLIGAYRDNEVSASHPLMLALDSLRKAGSSVQHISLRPLAARELNQLVADSLHCESVRAEPLAQLVYQKTGGNPFFAIQFLTALVEDGLLSFDPTAQVWNWNLTGIGAQRYTDNVADVVIRLLHRLPNQAQEALQQFACLGQSAEVAVLTRVHGGSEEALHTDLWPAVHAGLVFRSEHAYSFLHDRVREAAYSLIPEVERPSAHLRIGRLLLAHTPQTEDDAGLFELANHFNRGAGLITDPVEKGRIAEINLRAGRRAKAAGAFSAACVYLTTAMELLPADPGGKQTTRVRFKLLVERSECEYLARNYAVASGLFEQALQQAETELETASVLHLEMKLYTSAGQFDRAIEIGRRALKLLGMDFPADDEEVARMAQAEWTRVRRHLEESETWLKDAPEMRDPIQRLKAELLVALIPPFTDTGRLFPSKLASCRLAELLITDGYSDATMQGCCAAGMAALWESQEYDFAWRMGRLSLDFSRKSDDAWVRASVNYTVVAFLDFWRSPWNAAVALASETYGLCFAAGNYQHAYFTLNFLFTLRFCNGGPVSELDAGFRTLVEADKQFGPFPFALLNTGIRQFLRALHGRTRSPASLSDGDFDEEKTFAAPNPGVVHEVVAFWKLSLCCLFREPGEAREARRHFETAIRFRGGLLIVAEGRVFDALLLLMEAAEHPPEERQKYWSLIERHREELRKLAELFPPNFAHRSLLVEALCYQSTGEFLKAERAFEDAIVHAHEQGSLLYEAMAAELAAEFYQRRGLHVASRSYLRNAWSCYLRWGSEAKIEQLQRLHPELAGTADNPGQRPASSWSVESLPRQIDLISLLKAAQSISSELLIDRLVEKLLRIVVENAGAQTGCLFVAHEAGMTAAARLRKSGGPMEFPDTPISETAEIAQSVVAYVQRTGESVILRDASADATPFSEDRYLQEVRPKSVFCLPLKSQAKLIGVLYLENHLVAGAFTAERLAALEVLASQAAVSLENAALYARLRSSRDELEKRVAERTRELQAANKELEAFSYSVSHDLRAPVRSIDGFAYALQQDYSDRLDDEGRANLSTIRAACRRLGQLIEDIMSLSRVAHANLRRTTVDLSGLARAVADELQSSDPRRSVAWVIEPGLVTQADEHLMRIVLENLLGNAWKFTGRQPAPRIEFGRKENDGVWGYSIRDNGAGFDPQFAHKLFGAFQRLHSMSEFPGTGVGLATVQRIIHRHGGRVWAEGTPGAGATFSFTLPDGRDAP